MNRVRSVREANGLTQAELARRLRMSGQNLSTIERGLIPGPRLRRRLARALGEPEEVLFPSDVSEGAPHA